MKKNIEALYIPIAIISFHIIYLVGSIVLNHSFVGFYFAIFLRTWTDPVIALSILFIGIILAFLLKNYFISILMIFAFSVIFSIVLHFTTSVYSFHASLLQYVPLIRFFSLFTGLSIILLLCNYSSVKKLLTFNK